MFNHNYMVKDYQKRRLCEAKKIRLLRIANAAKTQQSVPIQPFEILRVLLRNLHLKRLYPDVMTAVVCESGDYCLSTAVQC